MSGRTTGKPHCSVDTDENDEEERDYTKPCPDCGTVHGPEGLTDEQIEAIAEEGIEDGGVIRLKEGDGAIILRASSGVMQALMPPRGMVEKGGRYAKIALGIARMQALLDEENDDLVEELDKRLKRRGMGKLKEMLQKLGISPSEVIGTGTLKLPDSDNQESAVRITEYAHGDNEGEGPPPAVKEALQEMARKVAKALGVSDVQLVRVDGETGDVLESTSMDVQPDGELKGDAVKPSAEAFAVPGSKTVN